MSRARKRLGLLHGFTGSPDSWDRVVAALEAQLGDAGVILEVRRPALLGHSGAEAPARSFVEEADRLLDAVCGEAERVDLLCGYSLGGRLALTATLRRPERVARLVLVGAHIGLERAADRDQRRRDDQRWIELLEREGIEAFVDAWEALPLFAHQAELPPEVRAAHRTRRLAHHPHGLATALRQLGLAEMPPTQPQLHRLTMPVTLVAGHHDEKFNNINKKTAPRLPAPAPRLRVGGSGHDVVLERPGALATILAGELSGG